MASPNFFAELKRRNVYKVAIAYAVVGWLVIQIASTILPTFHAPEWAVQTLIVIVALAAWGVSLAIPPIRPAASPARFEWNFAAITARAIGQATERPAPFRAMLGISWFWLAGALYLSQFPTYVRFVLGSEEAVVTLFLAVFSVGVGAGSMLCNRLLRGRVSAGIVPWGMLGLALFSIDLCLASPNASAGAALTTIGGFLAQPASWRILADLFGIAASGGVFIVPLYTLLQTGSDEARRAQTIGANNIINAAAMVLSAVLTMALVAAGISVPGLFLLTGIASLGVAALFWRIAPSLAAGSPQFEARKA